MVILHFLKKPLIEPATDMKIEKAGFKIISIVHI